MEPIQKSSRPSEYAQALRVIAQARVVLLLIVALCILIQLVGVLLVSFMEPPPAPGADPEARTETRPASRLQTAMFWLLPATKFAALAACLLLVLTLMLAVDVSLVGHLGGVTRLLRAFFLCLILLVMLVPWQQILHSSLAAGALCNLGQLQDAREALAGRGILARAVHYARFVAYPVVALLLAGVVHVTFSRAYRRAFLAALSRRAPAAPGPRLP